MLSFFQLGDIFLSINNYLLNEEKKFKLVKNLDQSLSNKIQRPSKIVKLDYTTFF